MEFDELSGRVIGCALHVHRELGPGLLESAYEVCLACELNEAGIAFEIQYPIPVIYNGIILDCGYRIDMLVEKSILIELKSVKQIERIHHAQILTYMKLANIRIGLLMNFNVLRLKNGIRRFVF